MQSLSVDLAQTCFVKKLSKHVCFSLILLACGLNFRVNVSQDRDVMERIRSFFKIKHHSDSK